MPPSPPKAPVAARSAASRGEVPVVMPTHQEPASATQACPAPEDKSNMQKMMKLRLQAATGAGSGLAVLEFLMWKNRHSWAMLSQAKEKQQAPLAWLIAG